ncbi:hypothetical protein PENTCL1PPCAC_323, partial [Pristionchus entomophagus]
NRPKLETTLENNLLKLVARLAAKKRAFPDSHANSSTNFCLSNDDQAYDAKPFEMTTILGEKDIISTLPDDCLISVLSHLDRDSFETMGCVNQKMHSIASHDGWTKPRRPIDSIVLLQDQKFRTIHVNPVKKEDYCLMFESNSSGEDFKKRFKGSYDYRDHMFSINPNVSEIPEKFFKTVQEINSKHCSQKLEILR